MTIYLRRAEVHIPEGSFYFSLCPHPRSRMLGLHPELHEGYIGSDGNVVHLRPAYFTTKESALKFAQAYLPEDVEIIQ